MKTINYIQSLVHPVTLLSTSDGEHENIATMSYVSALSKKPPLLMVSVSPLRYSHDLMLRSGEFAILVLGEAQREMATLAGTLSGADREKWNMPPFKQAKKPAHKIKAPLLRGCLAAFECILVNHISAGDHTLFIGEVVNQEQDNRLNPLILFNRKYFSLGNFIEKYP